MAQTKMKRRFSPQGLCEARVQGTLLHLISVVEDRLPRTVPGLITLVLDLGFFLFKIVQRQSRRWQPGRQGDEERILRSPLAARRATASCRRPAGTWRTSPTQPRKRKRKRENQNQNQSVWRCLDQTPRPQNPVNVTGRRHRVGRHAVPERSHFSGSLF